MNLDHPNAEAKQLLHVGHDIGGVPRMQAAAGEQALGILFHVVGDELIHAGGEADDFGGNVVDQHGAIDAGFVEMI